MVGLLFFKHCSGLSLRESKAVPGLPHFCANDVDEVIVCGFVPALPYVVRFRGSGGGREPSNALCGGKRGAANNVSFVFSFSSLLLVSLVSFPFLFPLALSPLLFSSLFLSSCSSSLLSSSMFSLFGEKKDQALKIMRKLSLMIVHPIHTTKGDVASHPKKPCPCRTPARLLLVDALHSRAKSK